MPELNVPFIEVLTNRENKFTHSPTTLLYYIINTVLTTSYLLNFHPFLWCSGSIYRWTTNTSTLVQHLKYHEI